MNKNNNKKSNEIFRELISITAEKLQLPHPYVIEKDFYVTKAISLLTQVEHDAFELVFQGGTCLAKAHRIIKRMSEDCDFRIRIKPNGLAMSKGERRKALRLFRHELIGVLNNNDFTVDAKEIRVRNEGQFMSVRSRYLSLYPVVDGIKPYLALEFFLGEVRMPTESKPVTTLIQQVLGDVVNHETHPINSVAVIETAVEKWVALTRRVATSTYRQHYRDKNLVRHLYDLYCIEQHGLFTDFFQELAASVVDDDRQQYKQHNVRYFQNPADEIRRAIDELKQSLAWEDNWHQFLDTMVYGDVKPTYQQVLDNVVEKTTRALSSIGDFF